MCDSGGVGEGGLRYDGDVVAVQGEDAEVLESAECLVLDALEPIVGDDEGGEAAQVGEHQGRQHHHLVVTQVSAIQQLMYKYSHTAKTKYRNFETNIPRKGISRVSVPISTFMRL